MNEVLTRPFKRLLFIDVHGAVQLAFGKTIIEDIVKPFINRQRAVGFMQNMTSPILLVLSQFRILVDIPLFRSGPILNS